VKKYKEKKIFLHSKRRDIWPQVLGNRIYSHFFQHYEKNIAYRKEKLMRSLFLASTSWLESVCHLAKEIINAKIA
jgi:hypothetical protein